MIVLKSTKPANNQTAFKFRIGNGLPEIHSDFVSSGDKVFGGFENNFTGLASEVKGRKIL